MRKSVRVLLVSILVFGAFSGAVAAAWWHSVDLASQPVPDARTLPIDLEFLANAPAQNRGKILAVVTNTASAGEGAIDAGLELTELSRAYYVFKANGYEVEIASPQGGRPPVKIDEELIEADYAFLNDPAAQELLAQTLPMRDVRSADYAAVSLQVNFRGSTGMGRATFDGGVGEFGRKMSDDIDDAVAWAVAQGFAQADRVCLLGGSYGGYATLVGLVRKPGRYRCGVDYAGPVDLATLVRSFPPGWGPFLPRSWYRFVGDPKDPAVVAELAKRSPLGMADRIEAPLLIFQGANDPRVTQDQSDRIVCALRRKGTAVEYLLAANEGHSFANEETGLAVRRATELFLAKHLGGRAEQAASPRTQAALNSLRAAGDAIKCSEP